jgi:hypothetical protein
MPRQTNKKDLYNLSMDGFTVTGFKGKPDKSFVLLVDIKGNKNKTTFKHLYLDHKPNLKHIPEEAIHQYLLSDKFLTSVDMSADTTYLIVKAYMNFIEYLYDR